MAIFLVLGHNFFTARVFLVEIVHYTMCHSIVNVVCVEILALSGCLNI